MHSPILCRTYQALVDNATDGGWVYNLSQREIAREADAPIEAVRAALTVLAAENYVHITSGYADRVCNMYRVALSPEERRRRFTTVDGDAS